MTALERERLWQKYNRKWREYIPKYQKAFNKDLRRKGREVAKQIDQNPLTELERFTLGDSTAVLIKNLYTTVGKDFTTISDRDIKARYPHLETKDFTVSDDFWSDFVDTWLLSEGGQKITTIDATTRADILAVIQAELAAGADLGLGVDEISRNIKRELTQGSYLIKAAFRAERIARTEVVGASNLASFATAQSEGADLVNKIWIARDDSRTREAHADEEANSNREPLPLDQAFRVTGLMHPHAAGPASQVVNCRCVVGYVEKSQEQQVNESLNSSIGINAPNAVLNNPNYTPLKGNFWSKFKGKPAEYINGRNPNTRADACHVPGRGVWVDESSKRYQNKTQYTRVIAHEYGHNLHHDAKLINFNYVDERLTKAMKEAKKLMRGANRQIYDDISSHLEDVVYYVSDKRKLMSGSLSIEDATRLERYFEFVEGRWDARLLSLADDLAAGDLTTAEIGSQVSSFQDVLAALTKGRIGYGHAKAYWKLGNRDAMEIFAHSCESYAAEENVFFKTILPQLHDDFINVIKSL